jgi:hypothetical protein
MWRVVVVGLGEGGVGSMVDLFAWCECGGRAICEGVFGGGGGVVGVFGSLC